VLPAVERWAGEYRQVAFDEAVDLYNIEYENAGGDEVKPVSTGG